MGLEELAEEYRESAAVCRERVRLLRQELQQGRVSGSEELTLRRRINMLAEMASQTAAIGCYLRNYYGRSGRNAGRGA